MDENRGYLAVAVVVVFLYNLFVKSTIKGMIDTAMRQMGEFAKECINQMDNSSKAAIEAIKQANKDNTVCVSVLIDEVKEQMQLLKDEIIRNRKLTERLLRQKRNEPEEGSSGSERHIG